MLPVGTVALRGRSGANVSDSARLQYAAGMLGAGCVIASLWLMLGACLRDGNWLRWLYERPSMMSFPMARPAHFIKLFSIRFLIVLGAGFALYGQLVSFHIRVPLVQTLALTPLIVAIGNSPFRPGGEGNNTTPVPVL